METDYNSSSHHPKEECTDYYYYDSTGGEDGVNIGPQHFFFNSFGDNGATIRLIILIKNAINFRISSILR